MADYAAIRAGLKTRLETISSLVAVYDTVPDRVVAPSAVVAVGSPVADYHDSMSGAGGALTRFNFEVIVLAARWEPTAGQDQIAAYISGSGSVPTAIEGDATLGGDASTTQVTRCVDLGQIQVADSQYYGGRFTVEVYAR